MKVKRAVSGGGPVACLQATCTAISSKVAKDVLACSAVNNDASALKDKARGTTPHPSPYFFIIL